MRSLILAVLACACLPAATQSLSERAAKDELVFMQDEEPAMRKAFQRAKETLDSFLANARSGSPDHSDFSLKVAVSQGKDTEYFWVSDFVDKGNGRFEGTIANEPRMVRTVRFGQRYSFQRSHIVDWTYIDKAQRRMAGNFTLWALLTKEPRQEAEAVKRRFNLDCSWLP